MAQVTFRHLLNTQRPIHPLASDIICEHPNAGIIALVQKFKLVFKEGLIFCPSKILSNNS